MLVLFIFLIVSFFGNFICEGFSIYNSFKDSTTLITKFDLIYFFFRILNNAINREGKVGGHF